MIANTPHSSFQAIRRHLSDYLAQYPGNYVIIKGEELVGIYERIEDALTEATRLFEIGAYWVRQVLPVQEEVSVPALTLGILARTPDFAAAADTSVDSRAEVTFNVVMCRLDRKLIDAPMSLLYSPRVD